jgi:hypothetical protein
VTPPWRRCQATKIYSLSIERFRGITSLDWRPARA